jgi:hypothetical protein
MQKGVGGKAKAKLRLERCEARETRDARKRGPVSGGLRHDLGATQERTGAGKNYRIKLIWIKFNLD